MTEPVSFDRIADRYDETRGGLERDVEAATRQGLRLRDRRTASRGYLHMSPATVAKRLAGRSWSWM